MKALFLFSIVIFSLSAFSQSAATKVPVETVQVSHQIWDDLLKKHVNVIQGGKATQVDYKGMSIERNLLNNYLVRLEKVSQESFDTWRKEDQLAFLINAYNAWTVALILTKYPDLESIKDLGSFFQSPWGKSFIPLLGEMRSLDDIEHGLIRGSGRYNDPRIHFAVNCASIGCPALRSEAYFGEKLDTQLENAVDLFLRDRSRNRVEEGEIKVSRLFKWYREDFEKGWRGINSLAQFLAGYADSLDLDEQKVQLLIQEGIDIEFLEYDWHLNSTH